ncbi:unnamed protein product [Diamesa serratosioi]
MSKSVFFLFSLLVITTKTSSATNITSLVFPPDLDAIPAAYGDFNSDELTDVFVLSDDFRTIEILLGSELEPLFHRDPKMKCHYPDLKISSVVPGDFNGDAFMDVMFTVKVNESSVGIFINYGGSDYMNCTKNDTQPIIVMLGEPLALDYKDDMIIDLFGMDWNGTRKIWIFDSKAEITTLELKKINNTLLTPLSIPHSHAVLDINQDYLADLFLTTEKDFEIWYGCQKNGKKTFCYNKTTTPIPIGNDEKIVGQSLFLDIELNGELTQVLPICLDKHCKKSAITVQSGDSFQDLKVSFEDDNKLQWGFPVPNKKEFYRNSITLRGGDFNNDGYPDLLVTLSKNGTDILQTFLMENIKNPNAGPSDTYKRTFIVRWSALEPFGENTVMGSFYDFYQDGILDVIMLQKNGNKYQPLAFRNTLDYDANFVKVIVLTGLINKKHPKKKSPFGRNKKTWGTNLPGPRIEYNTTTQDGLPQHGVSSQLPQSAYFSLHLPYTIFGLGRTPNFVDTVKIGLSQRSHTWNQLIPNSQIIVIPWPTNEPQNWKAQLFVTPSKIILKSVFALSGICVIILLIIVGLHIKERREDKLEKLQEAHRFHFDAM